MVTLRSLLLLQFSVVLPRKSCQIVFHCAQQGGNSIGCCNRQVSWAVAAEHIY